MDLNNRRTGKDATKLRALGLLGHSDVGGRRMPPYVSSVHFRKFCFSSVHDLIVDMPMVAKYIYVYMT